MTLVGKSITGLSDDKQKVSGVVSRVTVVGGTPKVYVGNQVVSLNNISDVLASGTASPSA